jgi:hypothetical protein
MNRLPDVHWGRVGESVDWRKLVETEDQIDVDPDDEELAETPPDVVAMLGFDPAKTK